MRPLLAVVFFLGTAAVIASLLVPNIEIGTRSINGIGWFVIGLRDFLRNMQHQSQVFVIGFLVASVALILWIISPRLEKAFAESE